MEEKFVLITNNNRVDFQKEVNEFIDKGYEVKEFKKIIYKENTGYSNLIKSNFTAFMLKKELNLLGKIKKFVCKR